ncbi:MAG: HD domain-containing protein [Clostridia bacterium]|uniref:HD domain-containing protein n=1 Tax=Bianquea renquensis TaxID=2763661 RepID=A0A926DVE5_9FIRM|nr:HD domain-containing protein [Bianquea renquensis]MBC8544618.1 HD domain-containing protein [Bianquea renquensis]
MRYEALVQEMKGFLGAPPLQERQRHSLRVARWAQRLCASQDVVDTELVVTAAILHDIGYSVKREGHSLHSAELVRRYGKSFSFENKSDKFLLNLEYIIRNHSRKEWLQRRDIPCEEVPLELILLMEADLLDGCGPMSIMKDCFCEGQQACQSFEKTFSRIRSNGASQLACNPMVTEEARAFWRERQCFTELFLEHLILDLGSEMEVPFDRDREALAFMEDVMRGRDLVPNRMGIIFPFRQRSAHMCRAYWWALRLMSCLQESEALRMAVIFHDVGYSVTSDGIAHAYDSSRICAEYLRRAGYEETFIQKVTWMIDRHSDKRYLTRTDNPLEFQLLLEADHLDETGALAILWDCMAEGANPNVTYGDAYEHILKYSGRMREDNPLKTEAARGYWSRKQGLVDRFIKLIQFDLETIAINIK